MLQGSRTEITVEPACRSPQVLQQFGDFPGAQQLRDLAAERGLLIDKHEGEGYLVVDDVQIRPSLGLTATEIATSQQLDQVVLFDASTNHKTATLVAISKADTCGRASLDIAIGFFQTLGKQVVQIDDVAGMLVTRTLCMLANEAAQAVSGIASVEDVDLAMLKGVNYPVGPLSWADGFGNQNVVTVLDNMARAYPDGRYRTSALLRRKAQTNTSWNRY